MKYLLHNIQKWIVLALMVASIQSCTDVSNEMDRAEVSFTATLPADICTRSFGDAGQVNTLIIGILNDRQQEIDRQAFSVNGTMVNIRVSLVQSQVYNFVFWAYDSSQKTYDLTDLTAIRMNELPTSMSFPQSEAMDAFYSVIENITVAGSTNYSVELVRPLAQINVGTTGEPILTSFTAKAVPDTFYPFSNTVGGTTEYTWNFKTTTTETFTANGKAYNYLSMGYVFAPGTTTKIATELTLIEGEKSITIEFPQVEIEANKRSNIVGEFTKRN